MLTEFQRLAFDSLWVKIGHRNTGRNEGAVTRSRLMPSQKDGGITRTPITGLWVCRAADRDGQRARLQAAELDLMVDGNQA